MVRFRRPDLLPCWLLLAVLLAGCGAPAAPAPTPTQTLVARSAIPAPQGEVSILIQRLNDPDGLQRAGAAYALGELGDSLSVPALAQTLFDAESTEARLAAAWALGAIGSGAWPATPLLISVLHTDAAPVRAQAAESLGLIGDPAAAPALARALDDPDPQSAFKAAQALEVLAGIAFSESGSGEMALAENGDPALVRDARNWWRNSGQFQDWLGRAQNAAATATRQAASPTPPPSATASLTPTPQASATPSLTATQAETPTPEFTPTPTLATGAQIVIARVDKVAEYVDLQNLGDAPQALEGWRLVSEKGNQVCQLSGTIGPGETLRVWTNNPTGGGFNCGFAQNIWNNSEPDPAVLYDADGREVSRSGGG